MSWQKPRERVSLLADLAIRKENVSRKLAELRKLHAGPDGKPLAQEKAAARIGVSMRQWQRWEAGESVPYPRNLGVIAEHFGFDVGEFYDDERPNPPRVVAGDDRLDQILTELRALRAARDETAAQIQNLLQEQSELLKTIRSFVQEAPVEYAARVVARLSEEREAAAGREAQQPKPRAPHGQRPAAD